MKIHGGIGVLLCAALAAGCSQDTAEERADLQGEPDSAPYEELETAADTAVGYGTSDAAPVTPTQGGARLSGALTATGQFEGIAEGAPPGSVTVTESGQGSRLLISITRYTAGTELTAVVVGGSCQRPGRVVHAVPQSIQIDASGVATLDAQLPIPISTLLNGEHSVRLDAGSAAADPQMTLACADLPEARQG